MNQEGSDNMTVRECSLEGYNEDLWGYRDGFRCMGIEQEPSTKEYRESRKPDWCPIKRVPERAYHEDYCDNGRYDKGWNDCLDELLKDGG